ncbi:MAG TPA: aspartate dehydrogenase domain-containing protein, partial [Candidatus Eisenbacteria bacterium]|nr:aspartate dehydrogenase domain-containing protein [Candidatus Eisenbacteria bacterium]
PAREACRAFPANVNVLAALSLAGIGPDRTRTKIFAVPGQTLNKHRIVVAGEFGRLSIEIENVPTENPRTGKLSAFSTIAFLRDLGASLRVGT